MYLHIRCKRRFRHFASIDIDHDLICRRSKLFIGISDLTNTQTSSENNQQIGILYHYIPDPVTAYSRFSEKQRVIMPNDIMSANRRDYRNIRFFCYPDKIIYDSGQSQTITDIENRTFCSLQFLNDRFYRLLYRGVRLLFQLRRIELF